MCLVYLEGLNLMDSGLFLNPMEPPDREKRHKEGPLIELSLFTPSVAETKLLNLGTLRRKKRRVRRSHGPRLMRVGCSLGTCQVQILNHRLWQLMGQSGKEDSPIELSNPHSYG
uniref:Uncharacterized protein n=1 Tax=Xenopus tropicalis TaxID=8364 RepID=A0A6I8REF2_XENTR